MENIVESFKKELHIDKNSLDKALETQAAIYFQISEEYALAVSRRDEAYENIKQVDAQLNVSLRKELEDDGKKVTEALVSSAVMQHKDHNAAVENHLQLKLDADILSALKESFHQRSYMLREMIELYIAGYFAETSHTASTERAAEVQHAKSRTKMAIKRHDAGLA